MFRVLLYDLGVGTHIIYTHTVYAHNENLACFSDEIVVLKPADMFWRTSSRSENINPRRTQSTHTPYVFFDRRSLRCADIVHL